ncbi:MAG: hypothetical protein HY962_11555 [Ignavibacteriae bacterium]|nr:hypothetical protein [Ignavibacteriota bacterium]
MPVVQQKKKVGKQLKITWWPWDHSNGRYGECLSPHRVLATADENIDGTVTEQEEPRQQNFTTMILENLKKASVQDTRQQERLVFSRLDPWSGAWRHSVLPAKMNPDLAMGDELLKKTGAGNLFMVFGEPDVEVREDYEGRIIVEIKGMDVYDPSTGQIRNSSTDDIACWFIDTDYNGESFFVRHAYFTGADEPYDKLKRALRADIDEAAWASLYSTISTPFTKPLSGKIAVKVINHYGDEVVRVMGV